MKPAVIHLLFALLLALCLPSFALTKQEAIQAVKDFEDDQTLVCGYSGALHLDIGLHEVVPGSRVWCAIQVGGDRYQRIYEVTESGAVAGVRLPDKDPAKNPAAALLTPITEPQAKQVAETFCAQLLSDYASCDWDWRSQQWSADEMVYQVAQVASNGARTDRYVLVSVSLAAGTVFDWHRHDYSLPPEASATPAITPEEAEIAAAVRYTGLAGLTPVANELSYFADLGLVHQLTYLIPPPETASIAPPLVWVDASSGEVVWADFYLGGSTQTAPPSAQVEMAPPPAGLVSNPGKTLLMALVAVLKAIVAMF